METLYYMKIFLYSNAIHLYNVLLKRDIQRTTFSCLSFKAYEISMHITYGQMSIIDTMGAQWLSGRLFDLRLRGCGFEPHRRHCVVSLRKTHLSLLSTDWLNPGRTVPT